MPLTPEERHALEAAHVLRSKGYNPIPSAIDRKQPLYKFAAEHGWDKPFPDSWFTEEAWEARPTTNLQVVCGRMPWRLLVIDLDGAEARYTFKQWGKLKTTWITHREDGDSWHVWLRLPLDYPRPLPKRFLWKGDGKHQAIERLCDQSLIVAPPSFHVVHRDSRYRFLTEWGVALPPRKLGLPADCPRWVLDLKPIEQEIHKPEFVPHMPKARARATSPDAFLDCDEILDRLPDKIAIAAEWGVRFTGHVSPSGWHECHAIDRPDNNPSAAIHPDRGIYTDKGSGTNLSFFKLAVATGNAIDFKDACAHLMSKIR